MNCYLHRNNEARKRCLECGKWACTTCMVRHGQRLYCGHSCQKTFERKKYLNELEDYLDWKIALSFDRLKERVPPVALLATLFYLLYRAPIATAIEIKRWFVVSASFFTELGFDIYAFSVIKRFSLRRRLLLAAKKARKIPEILYFPFNVIQGERYPRLRQGLLVTSYSLTALYFFTAVTAPGYTSHIDLSNDSVTLASGSDIVTASKNKKSSKTNKTTMTEKDEPLFTAKASSPIESYKRLTLKPHLERLQLPQSLRAELVLEDKPSEISKNITAKKEEKKKVKELASKRETKKKLLNITRGNAANMELALTFDGGSNTNEATIILDTLKARGITTTLFLTGGFIERYPKIVSRIIDDGHEVANHMYSHPHLTDYEETYRHNTLEGVTREFVVKELRKAEYAFKRVTGKAMAPYWRAPYGEVNADISQWANDAGYMHVGWTMDYESRESLDTLDWIDDKNSKYYLSSTEIKHRILSFDSDGRGLRGGIILMHLGTGRENDRAASVLGEMIDVITARGYSFVKVSKLDPRKRGNNTVNIKRNERVAFERAELRAD